MQHCRSSSKKITVALGATVAGFATVSAQAQEALEEIVVTALRRAESLQDAPATVTAFDAETVEQARIQSMRDYVNLTSNMTLMETQNNAFAFVNIRGLAQIRNVDPTVAVVVDGVLSTTSLAFSQELYDVQQIEVLKGPQGALYGRNATGGAVNITTKQPTTEPEIYVRGGVGNGDNVQFSAVASGPIGGDEVLGRIVVGYKDADGWRDNVATGEKADPYEDLTIAGKLLWEIGASTTLDLRATVSHTQSTGSQFISNAPNFVTGFPGTAQYPGNGTAPPVPGLPASITALIGDPNNTSIKHQGNEPGMDDREILNLSAKFDWEVGAGTLTSVTSLDSLDHVTAAEQFAYYPFVQVAGTPGAGSHPASVVVPATAFTLALPGTGQNLTFGQNRFHDSFSQELRFTSPDDQRLRWIGGIYFARTDLDVMIAINNDLGQGFVEQRTSPNIGGINPTATWTQRFIAPLIPIPGIGLPGALARNPNTNPNALAYNFDSNHNTAYAAFGQIELDLTDELELSAALRYDRDERELTIMAPDQFLPVFPFPSGRQGDVRETEFDSAQPKLTLSWRPNEDWTRLRHVRRRLSQRRVQLERCRDRRRDARQCRRPGLAAGRARLVRPRGHRGLRARLQVSAARRRTAVGRGGVRHGSLERLHVRVRRAVHGSDDAQHSIGRRQRARDEPLVARDGAPAGRSRSRLPRLGDHGERLGRRRRHQHRRQGDAAESRFDRELRVRLSRPARWRPRVVCAARLSPARRDRIGSRRISSRAIRCRSSTCGSASRPRAAGKPSSGSTTRRTRTGSPKSRTRMASSITASRSSTAWR